MIEALVRKEIAKMKAYPKPPTIQVPVKLNQNESPYNLPKEVIDEFTKRLGSIKFNLYNDDSSEVLRNKLAIKFKTDSDRIIVGRGIDELLYYVLMAFVNLGDKIVRPIPSFSMYEICAKVSGAVDCPVELDENFELTSRFIEESKNAKITFICRPNNPTGNSWDKESIEEIVQESSGLVVIDEAYADFAQENCLDLLRYDNVIIMRTFSKAASFAGGRLGFAIANRKIIEYLNRVRLPWNVSIMSQIFGETILDYDNIFLERITKIKNDRENLLEQIKQIVKVYPSDCNFFLFEVENPNKIYQKLISLGVLVRNICSYPMLGNCLRANVGTEEENEKFVKALKTAITAVDAIIFDIDGVLIDVSASYRQAIIRTVKEFTGRKITNEDITLLKQTPGFNNDWDVSYAICKEISDSNQIDRNSKQYQEMKDYFQRQYLGELIQKEKSLIEIKTLETLSKRGLKFGVVTSRPREEALFALRDAGLTPKYIQEKNIVAQEDAPEKPSPEPLLLAQQKLGAKNPVYVGDTSSDKLASERAGMQFIYCTKNPNRLLPYVEIESVNQLPEVI